MYSLYLIADPDETNQDYDAGQSCSICMVVSASSEDAAIERAEQALQENHWKDVRLQQIVKIPRENEAGSDPINDYMMFVFSEDEKGRLRKLKDEAEALVGGLDLSED